MMQSTAHSSANRVDSQSIDIQNMWKDIQGKNNPSPSSNTTSFPATITLEDMPKSPAPSPSGSGLQSPDAVATRTASPRRYHDGATLPMEHLHSVQPHVPFILPHIEDSDTSGDSLQSPDAFATRTASPHDGATIPSDRLLSSVNVDESSPLIRMEERSDNLPGSLYEPWEDKGQDYDLPDPFEDI
eukprot:TRINITY_DN87624_c0_g2_i1.p1 TRINITY_DN87624_c0_g2~~TRINITY_DN87624_c0_g2_i1.p1  ORF type:complete len:186 (-),score=26.45 TRINITY_DN87624_c0_g2_i1:160-717(-)